MLTSTKLSITETEPTPILHDFAIFINYLTTNSIVLTPKNEFLSKNDLFLLNQQMLQCTSQNTIHSNQDLYPLLHLFYHLGLAGKLFQRAAGKGSRIILRPTARIHLYNELSPTEKYFFLLETFWVDVDWVKLQAGYFRRVPFSAVPHILKLLSQSTPGSKIQLKRNGAWIQDLVILADFEYFWLYFAFFGFWHVTPDKSWYETEQPKRSIQVESIIPTVFGVHLASILQETRDLSQRNSGDRRYVWESLLGPLFLNRILYKMKEYNFTLKKRGVIPSSDSEEPFFRPFVPLFPQSSLQKTLPREGNQFVDGTYIFKVALHKNLWRRLKIAASETLLSLHETIQSAFNFDDDHLYRFFMDGKRWSQDRFVSLAEDEGPYVDEVRIGALGLFLGQKFLYLFDYGSEWWISIKLEKVLTDTPPCLIPMVIQRKGEDPVQYE